jgi:hypothetical protein
LPEIKEHLKTIKPIAMRYEKEKHDESTSSETQEQYRVQMLFCRVEQ